MKSKILFVAAAVAALAFVVASLSSLSAFADTTRSLQCGIMAATENVRSETPTHFAMPGYEVGQVPKVILERGDELVIGHCKFQ